MARYKVKAAPGIQGCDVGNEVISDGQEAVISDREYLNAASLIARGDLLDLGETTDPETSGHAARAAVSATAAGTSATNAATSAIAAAGSATAANTSATNAAAAATTAVNAHVAAADPHAQYARLGTASVVGTIYGTGDPNGVHVAPVGSTFRNTEEGGYNGARVWRKDEGIGSTGWIVESGDTGWITATPEWFLNGATWLPGGLSGTRIRRVGSTVTLTVEFDPGTEMPTGTQILAIPSGFHMDVTYLPGAGYQGINATFVNQGAHLKWYGGPRDLNRWAWSLPTSSPWPTTLTL